MLFYRLHISPILPPPLNIAAVNCPSEQYFIASISTDMFLLLMCADQPLLAHRTR